MRNNRKSRWINGMPAFAAVCVIAAVLGGCAATPRYQTVKQHIPPEGSVAQACMGTCATGLEACQQGCANKYETCAKDAQPAAQATYDELLRHYQSELTAYRWELERYRMELMLGGWHHPYGAWGWYPPFPPPAAPSAPDRERVVKNFVQQRCGQDCGCQGVYDACFIGCGGKIETRSQCIANCGGVKP